MSWKYTVTHAPNRVRRSHWFDPGSARSACGKAHQSPAWIDDVGGVRLECGSCERILIGMGDEP